MAEWHPDRMSPGPGCVSGTMAIEAVLPSTGAPADDPEFAKPTRLERSHAPWPTIELVTDPVCAMKIKPEDAVATIEHEGETYYFCSQDCADSFREAPEDYL